MSVTGSEQRVDWQLPGLIWGAAVGAVVAVLTTFKPDPWIWAATLLWLILWLTALLKLIEPAPRTFLAGTLRKSSFTQVYTWLVRPRLDRIWDALCDKADTRATLPATVRAALTWRLYDRAMLIAVVYPILLLIGQWAAGWEGRLGDATILPAAPLWPDRAVTIGGIALILLSLPVSKWASASRKVFLRKVSGWLPLIAFAVAVAFAGAFAFAVAVAFAAAVAVAFAFAGAVAFAAAVAVAFAFAGAVAVAVAAAVAFAGAVTVAGAVAVAVEFLDKRNRAPLARLLLTLLLPVLWIAAILLIPWNTVKPDVRGIFLFLGVLPLINALFDVLSYAVTLALMRRGLAARTPFLWGAFDFGIALILFLGLGATLTLVIAAMNALAGTTLFNLASLFQGITDDPNAYWWLYLMVFSTILPTALHFLVSLIGLQGVVPRPIRRRAAALIDAAPTSPPSAAVAPIALGTIWLMPFLATGVLGWGLWQVFGDAVETLGGLYFTALKALALRIGAL